jgi:hypothetical protein
MISPEGARDSELQAHLESCPDCAEHFAALRRLDGALTAASEPDRVDVLLLERQRRMVEARAARRVRPARVSPRLPVRRRLRWSLAALAAVALVLLAVVPFSYQRTLGYSVTVCCVDADLALETDTICDWLYHIGLDEADYDVLGCDTTCRLMIVDLQSQAEVHQVMTSLLELAPEATAPSVIPVVQRGSASLLHQAQEKVFARRDG